MQDQTSAWVFWRVVAADDGVVELRDSLHFKDTHSWRMCVMRAPRVRGKPLFAVETMPTFTVITVTAYCVRAHPTEGRVQA